MYPNNLKYSEFDAKSISENRLLLYVVEKSYSQNKIQKIRKFRFKPLEFFTECS